MVEIYATLSNIMPKGRTEDVFLCWHNTVLASMGFADALISHLYSPVRHFSYHGKKKKKKKANKTTQPKGTLRIPNRKHCETYRSCKHDEN